MGEGSDDLFFASASSFCFIRSSSSFLASSSLLSSFLRETEEEKSRAPLILTLVFAGSAIRPDESLIDGTEDRASDETPPLAQAPRVEL